MSQREPPPSSPDRNRPTAAVPQTIHIHNHPPRGGWSLRIIGLLLLISFAVNLAQMTAYRGYTGGSKPPYEKYVEGSLTSSDKIAILKVDGVIMPPYSGYTLEAIKKIEKDDKIKGVVVHIDSPGGLVADSHRIYAALKDLRETKPMVVSFGRMAASGGYYIAMGAGPDASIYAEPITWTGSIGVIIPRYDLSNLGEKVGVTSDSLKTGPLKDALDPFHPLSEEERRVWDVILKESLDEFVNVIDDGRKDLSEEEIRRVATGQIFTANQALKLKLVDKIGDRDAALEELKEKLQLTDPRIITYSKPTSLMETLLGGNVSRIELPGDPLQRLLDSSVPRAMYFFGWRSTDWQTGAAQ